MLDILETVNRWLEQNQEIALATVVETWGSAPRRQGAKMAVTRGMDMIGSVSGGCIEGAVVEEMMSVLDSGGGNLLSYGVSDDTAWEVGLTCGGKIKVFVEPLNVAWWQAVTRFVERDQRAVTATIVTGERAGQKILLDANGETVFATPGFENAPTAALSEQIKSYKMSAPLHHEFGEILVDVHDARPHLIIIGGVHIAIPLQIFAQQVGFRVSIVDPRKAFATEKRFSQVDSILHEYPDKALPKLGLDSSTYIAVLTHDPKIDDRALIAALPSPVPYVGVLSSARTHEKRLARLTEAGISEDLQARIYTPIGIELGASTPEEIALCIMAEIVAVRNGVR